MPETLFSYMQRVQQILGDTSQELINPADLIGHINNARREVAMRAQCIRVLPKTSGYVTTVTITDPGTGYSDTPTITISAPDSPDSADVQYPLGRQATAQATVAGGIITDISVTDGGSGYFQPAVTITDSTGTGATATVQTSPVLATQNGQEVYRFADIPTVNLPGVGPIIAVRSVTIIYANYRYSLPMYPFTTYQAQIRQYPFQYYYVPTMCAQRGQGADGSLYLYPLPSQRYQLELDCYCWPQDLTSDLSVEAIPDPWTQAVFYWTLFQCYLQIQNLNSAEYYRKLFQEQMARYRTAASPGRSTNPYGPW